VQLLAIYVVNVPFWIWAAGHGVRMKPEPVLVAEAKA
jgi:hypothetical protein